MRKQAATLLLVLALPACAFGTRTPQELRAAGASHEEVFPMAYQKLAYCLEDHGKPIVIDMQRSSVASVYGDLGVVEINTGYSLFELRRLDDNRTLARSFDGTVHSEAHKAWFGVLKSCATGKFPAAS